MSTTGGHGWFGWLGAARPDVGVEIAPGRVTAVAVERQRDVATITGHATEPLPPGALAPSLNAVNLANRDAVVAATRRVLAQVGQPTHVVLVVPDTAAKVSLVRFEKVPGRAADLEAMVRWQVRKAVPFATDRAQVAWTDGIDLPEGGRELVVVAMRREVVEEYESVCTLSGTHAGVVDVATFNLVNLALACGAARPEAADARPGDWLLVHLTPEYSSLAIVRGTRLVFYRNRLADAEGHLGDLVHQTAMYYEDRLGGGRFARVVVSGGQAELAGELGALRDTLEDRLRSPVETLDVRRAAALTDRIEASPDLLAALAAPVGLVLREA